MTPPVQAVPSVALILVNYNGESHLPACLGSIAALDYPKEKLEVIVVDNGSTDSSLQLLRGYPWVRVLPWRSNLGFASANNVGAAATDAECIAFVNTDMRLADDWLREMMRSYDPKAGYSCVAGVILDWEAERLDFADGVVNCCGFGNQVGFGLPLDRVAIEDGRELLFACGGSMLINRTLFLELGGFDPAFFAFFEDVDLGWRLSLAGHKVRLAAGARSFHHHHGTAGSFAGYQLTLLYERNALRMLIKNLHEDNLARVLSAALLMLVERTRLSSGSDRAAFELGAKADRTSEKVERLALAPLHAVSDVIHDLEGLMEERRRIQLRRRVSDAEIFRKFGRPFQPARDDELYLESMTRVTQALGLDELFSQRRATKVLVIACDATGEKMAGPGVRLWEITKAMARFVPVTLATASPVERSAPAIEVAHFERPEELEELVQEADIMLLQGTTMARYPFLSTARALRVIDLFDLWVFEKPENQRSADGIEANRISRRDIDVLRELLDSGDFFVCASERQRDYWLGVLAASGRVDRMVREHDPTLRVLVDVVPYGCPEQPPVRGATVLKGVHPAIGSDDLVILCGFGTPPSFDPLTVLEAFRAVLREEPRARLFFMGLEHGKRGFVSQRVAQELRQRTKELDLLDRQVVFGTSVPYDKRGSYLLEADLGVIAAHKLAEVRLAVRTGVLDHFWAGLPSVATSGDVLAGLIEQERAGIVVAPGEVEGMAQAILTLIQDEELRRRMAERAAALGERYRWSNVVEPLRSIVEAPWRWETLRSSRRGPVQLTEDAQLLLSRWREERHRSALVPHSLVTRLRRSRTARVVWRCLPEPGKKLARPLLRRL